MVDNFKRLFLYIPIEEQMGSANSSSRAKRGLAKKRSGWGDLQFVGTDKGLKADCHAPLL